MYLLTLQWFITDQPTNKGNKVKEQKTDIRAVSKSTLLIEPPWKLNPRW